MISALAVSQFSPGAFAGQSALLALYVLACFFLVKPGLHWLLNRLRTESDPLPGNLTAFLLIIIFASAIITYKL